MNDNRRKDGRETWNRLLNWDKGQAPSERLSGLILNSEGYSSIDPSHPLGGKDGTKDAIIQKDEMNLVMAVYFPRNQQKFSEIKTKFQDDLLGVEKNSAEGIVFVTNQELRLSERTELRNLGKGIPVEIYHLERNSLILNTPQHYGTRLEFLDITMTKEEIIAFYKQRDKSHLEQLTVLNEALEAATQQIIGYTSGGDSVPLCFFNSHETLDILELGIRIEGHYPIFDVSISMHYLDNPYQFYVDGKIKKDILEKHRKYQYENTRHFAPGTLSSEYMKTLGRLKPPKSFPAQVMINIYSRNKVFMQIVTIGKNKIEKIGTMSSITRHKGKIIHEWESSKISEYLK